MACAAFSSVKTRSACRRLAVQCRAAPPQGTRRDLLVAVTGAFAAISVQAPEPAAAFLGFGEDPLKKYTDDTGALLSKINNVLSMKDDKEAAVRDLKKDMNSWTAKYRKDNKVGGLPSFSNMYSAVNALAGHWNNFGADAPVPKKRMARITKELEDVGKLLARGR